MAYARSITDGQCGQCCLVAISRALAEKKILAFNVASRNGQVFTQESGFVAGS
jgi:hypothetical protein